MIFDPPLQRGVLIQRYKRFLADVQLDNGEQITLHCPNTGSMKNCAEPGWGVWFSDSGNAQRKYRHTWELVQNADGSRIGVNTGRANLLVNEAISAYAIPALQGYDRVRAEVKYGSENSRIDLLLERPDANCFVEIKSLTLGEGRTGFFPDAVTERGRKHLRELMSMVQQGHRAVLLFCVQHTGVDSVRPADHIDPAYGRQLREAVDAGVEVLAWRWQLSERELTLEKELPVLLD
ncbi:MAG TPA: DNA/RNA nuclease SfsA [Dongiaceae bacterium]|nr:DNA/RNA nuclease SfsA [Dongiaceae bacterium]